MLESYYFFGGLLKRLKAPFLRSFGGTEGSGKSYSIECVLLEINLNLRVGGV